MFSFVSPATTTVAATFATVAVTVLSFVPVQASPGYDETAPTGAVASVPAPQKVVPGIMFIAKTRAELADEAKAEADRLAAIAAAEAAAKAERVAVREARLADKAARQAVLKNPPVEAPFTIASFNALGYGHTAPGGNRKGWADGYTRTRWAIRALTGHGVDVVGLQEFQPEQHAAFLKNAGGAFGVHRVGANAVAWRLSAFSFVSATTVTIPYFGGVPTPQPVVRLRSTVSGQEVVVISVHNPADARGPAQRLRNIATANETAYVAALRAEKPRVPIFMTGDMNDREEFFCPFTESRVMRAAAGGTHTTKNECVYPPTRAHGVDWVFGSKGVTFSGYVVDRSSLVARASDHPLIVAEAG